MNAICLIVDRLHAGYLGAYGNTWVETPAVNLLASQSLVCDQAVSDAVDVRALYAAFWEGRHAMSTGPAARPSLPARLRDAGVHTALLSDQRWLREDPRALDFDEVLEIDPPWQSESAPEGHFEETHLARCFVELIDWLRTAPEPFLLWCHLGSLGMTWDAPLEFRQRYWEPGDPVPSTRAEVPDLALGLDPDPDDVLAVSHAYAAQVSLLDTCLAPLWEYLAGPRGQKTLLALAAPRGIALGEHGHVGPSRQALYAELVHVPLMVRFPNGMAASLRTQALVTPADLWATLMDAWQLAEVNDSAAAASLLSLARDDGAAWPRDRVGILTPSERAIRTPAWHLRLAATSELYVKPDDFWEVNNVADRCGDVVERLQAVLDQWEAALRSGQLEGLPPLDDLLLRGLE